MSDVAVICSILIRLLQFFFGVKKDTLLLLKVQKKEDKKDVKASKNANHFFVFPEVLGFMNLNLCMFPEIWEFQKCIICDILYKRAP